MLDKWTKRAAAGGLTLAVTALLVQPALAQEAADTFRQSCMSCHTIGGGRLVGPDLKNVEQRQERDWLVRFITNPKSVLDGGDPYALGLKEEARGTVMPVIAGMTSARASALLDLIAAESLLDVSQFAGLDISGEALGPKEIERGRRIFRGEVALTNGGPACYGCHTVRGVAALGGGHLGPDLSLVYERMQGRKNLASWLLAPATETMRPVFAGTPLTNEEILALVAFLEESARQGGEDSGVAQVTFLLIGLAGAVLLFVIADGLWRRRFRAVRRPLVESVAARIHGGVR